MASISILFSIITAFSSLLPLSPCEGSSNEIEELKNVENNLVTVIHTEVSETIILQCSYGDSSSNVQKESYHLFCRWTTPYLNSYVIDPHTHVERGRISWSGSNPKTECNIKVTQLGLNDSGRWSCEYGIISANETLSMVDTKLFDVNVQSDLTLSAAPTTLFKAPPPPLRSRSLLMTSKRRGANTQGATTEVTLVCHASKPFDICIWATPYKSYYTFQMKDVLANDGRGGGTLHMQNSAHNKETTNQVIENGRIKFFSFTNKDCGITVKDLSLRDKGEWQCQLLAKKRLINGIVSWQNATDKVQLDFELVSDDEDNDTTRTTGMDSQNQQSDDISDDPQLPTFSLKDAESLEETILFNSIKSDRRLEISSGNGLSTFDDNRVSKDGKKEALEKQKHSFNVQEMKLLNRISDTRRDSNKEMDHAFTKIINRQRDENKSRGRNVITQESGGEVQAMLNASSLMSQNESKGEQPSTDGVKSRWRLEQRLAEIERRKKYVEELEKQRLQFEARRDAEFKVGNVNPEIVGREDLNKLQIELNDVLSERQRELKGRADEKRKQIAFERERVRMIREERRKEMDLAEKLQQLHQQQVKERIKLHEQIQRQADLRRLIELNEETRRLLIAENRRKEHLLNKIKSFDGLDRAFKKTNKDRNEDVVASADSNNGLILIGGRSETHGVLRSAELLTSRGVCHDSIPPLPERRWKAITAFTGEDEVITCGGNDNFGDTKTDCWSFDLNTADSSIYDKEEKNWRPIPQMLQKRDGAGWAVETEKLYIFGGTTSPIDRMSSSSSRKIRSTGYSDTIEYFDLISREWIASEVKMTSPRAFHCVIGLGNGSVIISGGYGALHVVERFDVAESKWTRLPDLSPVRAQHGCAHLKLEGKEGLMIAGGDMGGTRLKDVRFLPFENGGSTTTRDHTSSSRKLTRSNSWKKLPNLNIGRWGRPAIGQVEGVDILVTGGWDGDHDLAATEHFDRLQNLWGLASNNLHLKTERRWASSTVVPLRFFPYCVQKQ